MIKCRGLYIGVNSFLGGVVAFSACAKTPDKFLTIAVVAGILALLCASVRVLLRWTELPRENNSFKKS